MQPLGLLRSINMANEAPENDVQVTWLGHSTVLMAIDGKRFLADPVWYQRVSPFTQLGPKRFFDVPLSRFRIAAA